MTVNTKKEIDSIEDVVREEVREAASSLSQVWEQYSEVHRQLRSQRLYLKKTEIKEASGRTYAKLNWFITN